MRALLSFFTALPGLRGGSLEDAARRVYLLPFVGLIVGIPGAALVLLSGSALPPGVTATLALCAVLAAQGLHHADGVLDVGDALMVRGDHERRRAVLKDTRVGIGGLGALFFVYGPTLAALVALAGASPVRAAISLLAAEAAARSAMLLVLVLGHPATVGSSSAPFVAALKEPGRRSASLLFALAIPTLVALPLGWGALAALLAAPLVALLALRLAKRAFGGIGGDLVGATGELTRTALLVALSAGV